jgi:MSHA biogenesis protein MshP
MNMQRGITLIGAIFVLIIVSLLGQYLINISGVQRQTSLLALQTARAYQAANAGIEWGAYQIISNGGSCTSNTELTPAIGAFTTMVSCNLLGSYDENGTIRSVYRITSHSEYGTYGQIDYVSRQIQAIVHD